MSPSLSVASLMPLRETLRTAGFSASRAHELTSLVERVPQPELRAIVGMLQLREAGDRPLVALVSMFTLGESTSRQEFAARFPQLDLGALAELEMIALTGDSVVPLVRLTELDGLFFAYDIELDRRPDLVVGISGSSRLTAAYTPRMPVETALDIGTGCGVHALLASRHARHVLATDVNPRALRLTLLNAALNGIENVETRSGSLFEPVFGERFGLIVANPPYVISPDAHFLYRDTELEGDALSRLMLAGLPDHLEDRGFATLQGNWAHARGAPWWSALEGELSESDCDAYVIRASTEDPLAYAVGWLSRFAMCDLNAQAESIRRWRQSYRVAGIEAITSATVLLRRRSAENWCCALTEEGIPRLRLGHALGELFSAQDRAARAPSDASLLQGLRRAPGLHFERRSGPDGADTCVLGCAAALGTRRTVGPAVAEFVMRLGGEFGREPVVELDRMLVDELRILLRLGYLTYAPAK